MLDGNFVEASVINVRILEISSSGEDRSRSFVPVCIKIMCGAAWILCRKELACVISGALT